MGYNDDTDAISFLTFIIIIALLLFGCSCVFYILTFRNKAHKDYLIVLSDFNYLWVVRLCLVLFGSFWAFIELIRLPLLKQSGWIFHNASDSLQNAFCRLHIVITLGILEPSFYLTLYFLVRSSLRSSPFTPRNPHGNARALLLVTLFAFPAFFSQLFFNVFIPIAGFNEGFNRGVPDYFTQASRTSDFDSDSHVEGGTALCTYPLFSTFSLLIFYLFFLSLFLYLCWKLKHLALNKKLKKRILSLQIICAISLSTRILFLGLSAASDPQDMLFKILVFVAFLSAVVFIVYTQLMFVLVPISEALGLVRVLERRAPLVNQPPDNNDDDAESYSTIPLVQISNVGTSISTPDDEFKSRSINSGQDPQLKMIHNDSIAALESSKDSDLPALSINIDSDDSSVIQCSSEPFSTLPAASKWRKKRPTRTSKSMDAIDPVSSEDDGHPLMFGMMFSSVDSTASTYVVNKSNAILTKSNSLNLSIMDVTKLNGDFPIPLTNVA